MKYLDSSKTCSIRWGFTNLKERSIYNDTAQNMYQGDKKCIKQLCNYNREMSRLYNRPI